MITVTITDHLQISGANAAWVAGNNQDQADAQAYLQSVLEQACVSYASQFSVDRITSGEFVLRFKPEEFAGINLAAETDQQINGFLQATKQNPTVRLADPLVTNALDYLVAIGMLTAERAAEISFYPVPVKSVVPEPVVEEPAPVVEPVVDPDLALNHETTSA